MKIAVVGAGFAGLASAKVLRELGHDVTVFEKAPDVGGVWSATRRYPGLRTQNNKGSYAFSDLPMPRDYPEWPSGEQVQAYLESYVETFGLGPVLRLSTEVVRAEPHTDGWLVTVRPKGAEPSTPEHFDHLVVANGVFSDPLLPDYEGLDVLERTGGRLVAASQVASLDDARGKHVVVVGYGKSACDVAAALGPVAANTTVVARHLLWKMPQRIAGALNYKYLLLTRMGEALFRYQHLTGRVEKFLHGPGDGARGSLVSSLGALTTRQLRLKELGLVPQGEFQDIARSTVSLTTPGFFDQVATGDITVHRDAEIEGFVEVDGVAYAELSDGSHVRADLVVCGTGYRQGVPFLSDDVATRLFDDHGSFALYRQVLPHDVPNLTFCGYNSSFFSPLSAEVAAHWIAAHLAGQVAIPPVEERRRQVADRLDWMEKRSAGKHARGTSIIPFSLHNIDELLADLGADISGRAKALQWLLPVDPSAYRGVTARLRERVAL